MKLSFIEALEEFLKARDELDRRLKFPYAGAAEKMVAHDVYESAARRLEEAHKISLMDIIKGEE